MRNMEVAGMILVVVPQIALNSTIHENDQQLAVLTIRKVRMLDSYHDSCPPQKKVDGHPFMDGDNDAHTG